MASGWYIPGLALLIGTTAKLTDDIRVILVDSTYVFDNSSDYVNDISAKELTGVGYSRKALTGEAVTAETNMAVFDANDVNWASIAAGETIGGIVVYLHLGADDSANPLLFFVDTADRATADGAVDITWPAVGSGGVTYIDNA